MQIIKKISKINEIIDNLEKKKSKINLIPTMGNIHVGHLSLLNEANINGGVNIVSIFINPTQFNKEKDYVNYPQTFEEDVRKLSAANCHYLFIPTIKDVYPNGLLSINSVSKFRNILCDNFRAGHFDGVTTIVKILFDICKPTNVFFGEKDFQQLKIIEQLIDQQKMPITLVKCPSILSSNKMSLSSRYLNFSNYQKNQFDLCARIINKKIIDLKKNINPNIIQRIKDELHTAGVSKIDYCEIREEENLDMSQTTIQSRLFIAFYIDEIRVIDNFILY